MRRALPLLMTLGMLGAAEPILEVSAVEVIGANHVHPDRVRFILGTRAGKSYAQSQLEQSVQDDVKAIEKMGPFTRTSCEKVIADDGRSVKIVYRFQELPYITSVRWETNDKVVKREGKWFPADDKTPGAIFESLGYFDEEKLRKIVETKPGTYLNPLLVENDRRAVERKLQDDGHRWARVAVETTEVDGGIALIYRINVGQEILVGQVVVEGLPDGVSWRTFESGSAYLPSGLLNGVGKPYQPDLVQLDEQAVVRALQDLGWLDAKLIASRREIFDYVRPLEERRRHGPDIAPDGEYNDRVVLIYTVDPGIRYRLGSVAFVGNASASQEQLREAFAMAEGDWYRKLDLYGDPREERKGRNRDKTLGAIERSRRVISNQGHARCRMDTDRRLDTEKHIVHLTLHVDEGGIYDIGRVDIHGNRKTRDAIVRRGMSLNPGDRWNDDELDDSKRQIERTGIFSGRNVQPRPLKITPKFPEDRGEDRPGEVDLVVDVDEKATGSLKFELGFSSASGVFGSIGYAEHNFDLFNLIAGRSYRGGNQDLSLDIFVDQNRKSISSTWSNPHVYDGPYALSVTGYRQDNYPFEWRELRLGGNVSAARNFFRNDLQIGLTYGYTDMEVTERRVNSIGQSMAADDVKEGPYFWNSTGLYQTYDRLNDRLMPTSGYLLRSNQTMNGNLLPATRPWAEYIVKGDGYIPLHETDDGGVTFIRTSGRMKFLQPLDGEELAPFFARYRGGGDSPNHRGFNYGKLTPRVVNRDGIEVPQGGMRDLLFTAEASFPVMGINEGIRVVTFVDHGAVYGPQDPITIGSMRTAAGFGLRFPIALPISLDFAWLLDAQAGEDTAIIHFGLGQTQF